MPGDLERVPLAVGAGSEARASAARWLALAALAALAWREGLAFALSSGGMPDVEHLLFDAADNPPWLVTLIAAALLVSRRAALRAAVGAPGSTARATWLLAPGVALLAWARVVGAGELALVGAIATAIAGAYTLAGARLARLAALPLGLLLFAVPIPGALVNQALWPLQLATARYAHWLVERLGADVVLLGDLLRTPGHSFIVVEGCSGLGSMEVLTLLALAWAWQTGASLRHGAILALAAPAIAFALNGPRVAALVLFPDSEVWSVHTTQGVVTFALGTLCIAALDRWLGRGAAEEAPEPARAPRSPLAAPSPGLLAWAGAAAVATLALPPLSLARDVRGPDLLPEVLSGFRAAEELEPDRLFLGSVRFTRTAVRVYEREAASPGAEGVVVFVGEDARRDRVTSVLSPKTALPGRGWVVETREELDLVRGYRGERVAAQSLGRRQVSLRIELGLGGAWSEALRDLLALDGSPPFARRGHGYVVRLATLVEEGPLGPMEADRRLRDALRALDPHLRALEAWRLPLRR